MHPVTVLQPMITVHFHPIHFFLLFFYLSFNTSEQWVNWSWVYAWRKLDVADIIGVAEPMYPNTDWDPVKCLSKFGRLFNDWPPSVCTNVFVETKYTHEIIANNNWTMWRRRVEPGQCRHADPIRVHVHILLIWCSCAHVERCSVKYLGSDAWAWTWTQCNKGIFKCRMAFPIRTMNAMLCFRLLYICCWLFNRPILQSIDWLSKMQRAMSNRIWDYLWSIRM